MAILRTERVPYATAGFGDTLTHDLVNGVPGALPFFGPRPIAEIAAGIDRRVYPREELCRILDQCALKYKAPQIARDNIGHLRNPKTYAIVTGQQAGLLGGPLFTLHKALTAIKLAADLNQRSQDGARFVPVFWVASDDHDLAEIDHAEFIGADGTLTRVRIPVTAASSGCSACDVFADTRSETYEPFRQALGSALASDVAAKEFADLYAANNLGDAFSALLYRWLGDLGLVVVQSNDVRSLAAPILLRELDEYDITSRLISESGAALEKLGYTPGFSKLRIAPHFFIRTDDGSIRAHIDIDERGFVERSPAFQSRGIKPRTYSKAELHKLIQEQPARFSASAALRPIVQQAIFPVAAAVLGPGEIAYWAQLRKVHAHFGVVWPQIVPRATLTLIDPRGEKALRKLGAQPASPADLFNPRLLEERLASRPALSLIRERTERILAEFDAMSTEVAAIDGGLSPLFAKTRERFAHELQRIAEKTQASLNQREEAGQNRVRYVTSLIRPKNSPQERVLCAGQFMTAHPELAREMLQAIDPLAREHLLIFLG